MTPENTSQYQTKSSTSFITPMVVGAGIALAIISAFVFGADATNPAWGKYWMIRPLLVTPLVGALGGAFYAFMDYKSSRGFNRTLAVLLSVAVYLIVLWLGIVMGLAGTMWD